ncbi:SOS response-associated peptidase [Halobellus sp. Atlit-38R]|uniref:SOS response-associated peptidase n=1 Tax=Halobellus sp. Atlit-38R TaxID=2282131 RepID=UPI000EF197E1|nr:SOS response-associated peptidase [Halobellus sp. Atlit-38R]RLM88076.1 SOS response-associated peptidase [Halobellus sp. Atlit-38R]
MCGRYTLFTPAEELASRFDATFEEPAEPRYNCAPGQSLPVLTNDDPDRFRRFKWGLIPSWADDEGVGNDLINARAETLAEKPSFEAAYERRRCLVPADGFYEWVQEGDAKQPYRVAFADDRPFAMAGLWERWEPSHTQTGLGDFGGGSGSESDGDDAVESFTIVTTEPNDVVADLHHRMAVVLDPDEEATWLHGDVEEAAELLDPSPGDEWEAYPVSTRVNSPANDAPALIEPV